MPNTYTRIYIHLVFAVLGREALISPSFKEDLYDERYLFAPVCDDTVE